MSGLTSNLYDFGEFRLDAQSRVLCRDGERIALTPKVFEVLLLLIQHSGEVISKDELMKVVWPDSFVEESNLTQTVFMLRKALGETPERRFILTMQGRGYRFVADVQEVSANGHGEPSLPAATDEVGSSGAPRPGKKSRLLWSAALVAVVIGAIYYRSQPAKPLTEKDTIVLADFANRTGDPVFDDTLKTAFNVSLQQSPFLLVLSDDMVAENLKLMVRRPDTKLTPDVARELCQRAGSKAYITGTIASLGGEYVLGLKAVNCQNGETLAQEQVTAQAKEKVLDALGNAASKMRGELGESLVTVRKFDVPLDQATTSSLEALEAFSLAHRADYAANLSEHLHAIRLDPNFAMAYRAVGVDYENLAEREKAREYLKKAFDLREHASEVEQLSITATYYQGATGELDNAVRTYQVMIESYPRTPQGYDGLARTYSMQGQYEKAVETIRRGLGVRPDLPFAYVNLGDFLLATQHFDEAREAYRLAPAREQDDYSLHNSLYTLAFLRADSTGMAEQEKWFAGMPVYGHNGLSLASDTEAYLGHLKKARELTTLSVESAIRADNKENAAIWLENAAIREVALGNPQDGKRAAAAGITLSPTSQSVELEAALAFAMAGDAARAGSPARELNTRFPVDTQVQSIWLPTIGAQLALNRKGADEALNHLQAATPFELGAIDFENYPSCLYPVYVRGQAYLVAAHGDLAAAEFQKILDHSGIVWNCWTGALARLGVARANALQARTSQGADSASARVRALAAYKDFLTLWKDADPDVPILKQAKAEYAKLQ